ncbi:MAG: hypothetical protein LBU32_26330 [Clostridiales bacterium]|nr:hypothetical protein [Clostridiales bacterium]
MGKLHRNVEAAAFASPIGESSLAGCGRPGIAPCSIHRRGEPDKDAKLRLSAV